MIGTLTTVCAQVFPLSWAALRRNVATDVLPIPSLSPCGQSVAVSDESMAGERAPVAHRWSQLLKTDTCASGSSGQSGYLKYSNFVRIVMSCEIISTSIFIIFVT